MPGTKGRAFRTDLCNAESQDGLHWTLPHLDLFPGRRPAPNNIVIGFKDKPTVEACAPVILDVPAKDRRGFSHLLMYRAKGRGSAGYNGIRIAGSKDGIHFSETDDQIIAHLHSDHHNSISFDPARGEYVMFCRAKDIYRAWGEEMIDTGASRRIARLASKELWTEWMDNAQPQTILVPDETDAQTHFNFFYGMPTRHHAGIYWGFLEPFRMNDFIHTELATSRDGFHFQRFAGRPKLIDYGQDGAWDDTMIFGSPAWVEVGDEWWFYYTGWDGPHGTSDRNGAVGLARARKEGLVSLRGPAGGGVVATRRLIWPGGDLVVNADASRGKLTVRVSDAKRKPVEGFDHADSGIFTGDNVNHVVRWQGKSLEAMKGRELRLEVYLENADLFTFRAGELR
jgi:hypothetical protein